MNYKVTNYKVSFPGSRDRDAFELFSLTSFKASRSWKNLTDTGEIILAKEFFFLGINKVVNLLKAGDPILLYAGYDGNYNLEFSGFISRVLDDMPVVLTCEDNMYALKREAVNKSYASVTLRDLLNDIVPAKYSIDAMDVSLGSMYLPKTTVSQVLTLLKDHYGIYSYFDGDTLISGKIYSDNSHVKTYTYTFFLDIIDNNLKYRTKEDIKIKVTMTSYLSGGRKKSVTVGDADGDEQKLICSNVNDVSAIKTLAQKALDRLKIDGYQGTMMVFGDNPIKHGDVVSLINSQFPERSGNYYVDAVEPEGNDMGSFKKVLTIGPKAS